MSEQPEVKLLDGSIVLRPDDKGTFDELLLMQRGECLVHAEMMDSGCLWIGLYPHGDNRRVVMWIRANRGKITVNAFED